MSTEARRAVVRIGANYVRLGATFLLGVILAPLLLEAVGDDGFGLVALLGSSVGIASLFQEVAMQSLSRELGSAIHDPDPAVFPRMYAGAVIVCAGFGAVTAVVFGLVALAAPLLEIPDGLLGPARWFIVAKAIQSIFVIAAAPACNSWAVTERFAMVNLWLTLDRVGLVVGAVVLLVFGVVESAGVGGAVIVYGFVTAGFSIAVYALSGALAIARDPRFRPRLACADRLAIRSILHTGFWNTLASMAMNMHLRLDAIIINLQLGVFGNLLFGLAVQLTSYARMLTNGMTGGLDAVAARLDATRGDAGVRALLRQSTRLHALAALPSAIAMAALAEPIIRVWVGARLDDPDATAPLAASIIRVLAIGIVCRSVSDGWVRVLYGAGHVRRVAPLIVAGGLCNPLLAGVLILVLPGAVKHTAVAWAFSGAMAAFHLVGIPVVTARCVGAPLAEVLAPCARPLAIALAPAPLLWLAFRIVDEWTLVSLAAALGAYAGAVALGAVFVGATSAERARIARAVRVRVARRHR